MFGCLLVGVARHRQRVRVQAGRVAAAGRDRRRRHAPEVGVEAPGLGREALQRAVRPRRGDGGLAVADHHRGRLGVEEVARRLPARRIERDLVEVVAAGGDRGRERQPGAVGRRRGLERAAEHVGDLPQRAVGGVERVDVLDPGAIAVEQHVAAVPRPHRLHVDRAVVGDRLDPPGRELDDQDVAEPALAPRRERDPRAVGRPRRLVGLVEPLAAPHHGDRRVGPDVLHRDHALGALVHRERDAPAVGRHRRIARAAAGRQPHGLVGHAVPPHQVLVAVLAAVGPGLLEHQRAVAEQIERPHRVDPRDVAGLALIAADRHRADARQRVAVVLHPVDLLAVGRVVRPEVALRAVGQRAADREPAPLGGRLLHAVAIAEVALPAVVELGERPADDPGDLAVDRVRRRVAAALVRHLARRVVAEPVEDVAQEVRAVDVDRVAVRERARRAADLVEPQVLVLVVRGADELVEPAAAIAAARAALGLLVDRQPSMIHRGMIWLGAQILPKIPL